MTEKWPIHTVVLDMDDTLFAERDYVISGFHAAGEWLAREHGVREFTKRAEQLFEAGRRGRIFDEALQELAGPDAAAWVPELVAAYREHRPAIRLLPEAETFLVWARPMFRLALVSDGYLAVQRLKASALGLGEILDQLVFTDQWGREGWKPAPKGFEEVMRQNPGSARGYVYIADNPRKDFIAPRSLGWRTVRVRRPGGEHAHYEAAPAEAAELEVASLAQLCGLFSPAAPAGGPAGDH